MPAHQILSCPFCRETYEGLSRCPAHDLTLVAFDELGADPLEPTDEASIDDDSPVQAFEPGLGRGWVAAGAALNALALGFEFVRGVGGSAGLTVREVAITAPSLWTLPLVSFVLLYVLRRRRTPRSLRSLRVLVPMLALISPLTFGWVLFRLHRGAAVWATGGRTIGLEPGTAWWLLGFASLLILVGGARLGVHDRRSTGTAE